MKKMVVSLCLIFSLFLFWIPVSACGCIDESAFDQTIHIKLVDSDEIMKDKDSKWNLKFLGRSHDGTTTKEIEVSEVKNNTYTFIYNRYEYPFFQLVFSHKDKVVHQSDFISIPIDKNDHDYWYSFDLNSKELNEMKHVMANGNKMIFISIMSVFLIGIMTKMILAFKMKFQNIQVPIIINLFAFSVMAFILLFYPNLMIFFSFTIIFTIIEIILYRKWLKTIQPNSFFFYPVVGLIAYYLILWSSFFLFVFIDSQF